MARSILRWLIGDLPDWARRDHPALRQELGTPPILPRRIRYGRALLVVLGAGVLLIAGYVIATDLLHDPAGRTLSESVNAVVYFPLLAVQIVTGAVALAGTSSVVSAAIRRQSWDSLRATEQGAAQALRARWVAVFYRLRGPIGVIVGVRVGLIVLLLLDLTDYQGRSLDLLISGVTPNLPLVLAILLMALTMTAALLIPLTALGFDAAVGLLIAATVREQTTRTLIQAGLILLRLVLVALLLIGATGVLSGQLIGTADAASWLLLTGYSAVGDWGLALLYLGRSGEIWAIIHYGILIPAVLVVFALAQAAMTDRLLVIAARRAQQVG